MRLGEIFSLEGGGCDSDAEYLETQAQVLQTDSLAVDVIRKLRLDQNPELMGNRGYAGREPADRRVIVGHAPTDRRRANGAGELQSPLKVKRDTSSRLILVSFSSHDPATRGPGRQRGGADVSSKTRFQTRHDAIMKSSEWLSRQLDDIRARRWSTRARRWREFQHSIGVTDIDGNKSTYTEHMGELSRQHTTGAVGEDSVAGPAEEREGQ